MEFEMAQKRAETVHKHNGPDVATVAAGVTLWRMTGRSTVTVAASGTTAAKMLLHYSHICLTTPEIKRSWFEAKKITLKKKTAQSKCSSRFSSNPSMKIFLGSHSTSRNKQFAKRSTSERDRITGREGKYKNTKNKTQITKNTS
jgi:hypothetical protein